jgi:MSHA pilin protein MshD
MPASTARPQAGLTLIELVVAIVVIGIGATAILLMLAEGYRGSPDPQLRIKAVELAQSYMDEIFTKRWDETTPPGGGGIPGDSCCGPDGSETRSSFDDVDDYHGLVEGQGCSPPAGSLQNADGQPRSGRYGGFCVAVTVTAGVGGDLGIAAANAKRIRVDVTNPQGETTPFTTYRLDF